MTLPLKKCGTLLYVSCTFFSVAPIVVHLAFFAHGSDEACDPRKFHACPAEETETALDQRRKPLPTIPDPHARPIRPYARIQIAATRRVHHTRTHYSASRWQTAQGFECGGRNQVHSPGSGGHGAAASRTRACCSSPDVPSARPRKACGGPQAPVAPTGCGLADPITASRYNLVCERAHCGLTWSAASVGST
jgi:hypothetical protein